MQSKNKISVIVLTHNDQDIVGDCLESIKWADEIIVVDDNSVDETLKTVEKAGVRKIIAAGRKTTFADRRNLGASQVKDGWLFYVDSDERVPPSLRMEIEEVLKIQAKKTTKNKLSAFSIPRRNFRLTKELHYGGWWPDYVLRLMKKEKLKNWEGELHEQPLIEGEVGNLKEALVHFSHRGSYEHKLQTTIDWSTIEANKLYESKHPPMTILRFCSAMGREFYKRMFKLQAYRDGKEGIMEVIYQTFSVFISYARLWELQQKRK